MRRECEQCEAAAMAAASVLEQEEEKDEEREDPCIAAMAAATVEEADTVAADAAAMAFSCLFPPAMNVTTLHPCRESASLVLLLSFPFFPFFLLTQLFFLSLISSTASFL